MWQLFILVLFLVIYSIKNRQNYFERHKIPYFKSLPLFGVFSKVIFKQKSVYESISELYNAPELKDEPFFGFYLFHQPALLVKDLKLIKRILTTDFNKFPTRFSGSDVHDPLGSNFIFFTKDLERRKIVRPQISPFFTGSKLKFIFDHIQSEMSKFLQNEKSSRLELDLLATLEPVMLAIIASVALGEDAQKNEDLHRAMKSIFKPSFYRNLEFGSFMGMRKVMKFFGFKLFGEFGTKYFMKLIPEVFEGRKTSGLTRNDFIDMLMKIKEEKKVEEEFLDAQIMMFIGGGKSRGDPLKIFKKLYWKFLNELANFLRFTVYQNILI